MYNSVVKGKTVIFEDNCENFNMAKPFVGHIRTTLNENIPK